MPNFAYHVSSSENKEQIHLEGLKLQIGKRSELCDEKEKAIYCFANKTAMENGVVNWLGDCFSSDEVLLVFKVNLEGLNYIKNNDEIIVYENIANERIVLDSVI